MIFKSNRTKKSSIDKKIFWLLVDLFIDIVLDLLDMGYIGYIIIIAKIITIYLISKR